MAREGGREVRLTEILRPAHVVAPLAASTVHEAVSQLARRLIETGDVAQPERLERLFTDQHVRDLIHIGGRVLLPHLRTEAVERLVVALGVTPTPLRISADDPSGDAQVMVLVLAPPAAADPYLQTVASLARALRDDATVDHLVAARSAEEVLAIPEILAITIQPRLTVKDVMTQRVYRVSPDDSVQEVLALVREHHLSAIPVVGEGREVLGMVTDRDLLRHFLPGVQSRAVSPTPEEIRTLRVRDVMSRSVICVSEDQALAEVTSIMVSKDLERLPVTSEGKLTGFLTRGDILRKLFAF
jgi:CBS domain-containing protein/mannitol/fructose-specific phosphotransferase system IIA component (Ntr-type)